MVTAGAFVQQHILNLLIEGTACKIYLKKTNEKTLEFDTFGKIKKICNRSYLNIMLSIHRSFSNFTITKYIHLPLTGCYYFYICKQYYLSNKFLSSSSEID